MGKKTILSFTLRVSRRRPSFFPSFCGKELGKEIKGKKLAPSNEFLYLPSEENFRQIVRIGYARISTLEQNLRLQQDALKKAGCRKILLDEVGGSVAERPGLSQIKELLRPGDTLVVWRLDRLGRSIKDLIEWVAYLEQAGVSFQSLTESINTASPSGKLTFHLFAALAEFERQLIRERTQAGLVAARARGRVGGRPEALHADKKKIAVDLYHQKHLTVKKICEMVGISKPTLYAYVRQSALI